MDSNKRGAGPYVLNPFRILFPFLILFQLFQTNHRQKFEIFKLEPGLNQQVAQLDPNLSINIRKQTTANRFRNTGTGNSGCKRAKFVKNTTWPASATKSSSRTSTARKPPRKSASRRSLRPPSTGGRRRAGERGKSGSDAFGGSFTSWKRRVSGSFKVCNYSISYMLF